MPGCGPGAPWGGPPMPGCWAGPPGWLKNAGFTWGAGAPCGPPGPGAGGRPRGGPCGGKPPCMGGRRQSGPAGPLTGMPIGPPWNCKAEETGLFTVPNDRIESVSKL